MNNEKNPSEKKGFYYGWVVFAVCFLMVMISLGFGSSTKGTYLKAICSDLGLKRSLFTLNDSLRYITTSILSFFFGTIVLKLGPRKMTTFGFLFLITSFTVYSFATQLWQFYIGGVFLGAGICWTTTTIVGYVVEKWFTNGKGTIMGIILAANGLGGVLSENVITRIVTDENVFNGEGAFSKVVVFFSKVFNTTEGWRLAYRISVLLFIIVGIIVFIFLRNCPQDMGLTPLGQDKVKKAKRGLSWIGYEEKDIYKKPFFYVSGVCVFITGFILQSMVNVSKPHMLDKGFSTENIVVIFSLHAIFLMASKILSGILFDKFGIRTAFGFCCICAVISVSALAFITGVNPASEVCAYIYSIVSAFGLPLETVMIPLLVSQLFGQKPYAKAMGYYMALNTFGYACGVPLTNIFYDKFGTYKYILLILTGVMVVCSVVIQFSIAAADRERERFLSEIENNK